MNTDDYIRQVEFLVNKISTKIDKMDYRLYKLEKLQHVDDSIKSFIAKNWWSIISLILGAINLITLLADMHSNYTPLTPT